MYLEPKGRNWGEIVNWDDLGKIYAGFTIAWTVIVVSGAAWLICNRRLPHIKIRNLPLALTSTAFLHIYLVKILLAYTTNGHFFCAAEYWIMSIYLPFGIALFQAYLTQLRSIWEQQQRLIHYDDDRQETNADSKSSLLDRWRALSRLHKSYCYIGIGMVVQLILTSTLYAETPTLQGDWSSYGKIPYAKGQALCRKSLPWVTSAFWQLFWSWIYGPYTLFKVRNIHDIHYWRFQVIVSVVVGLPGSPLWLAALYLPQFKPVNMRWVPPMWLAPGIIIIQLVTIFIPIFETYVSRRQTQRNASLLLPSDSDIASSYQVSNSNSSSRPSIDFRTPVSPPATSPQSKSPVIPSKLYTMHALRSALTLNHKPLLDFAATKEFSAENILFLTRVHSWRTSWSTAIAATKSSSSTSLLQSSALQRLFNTAMDIYNDLVNESTAEFPINIDFTTRKTLDDVFLGNGHKSSAGTDAQQDPNASATDLFQPNAFTFTRPSPFVQTKGIRSDTSDSEKTLFDKSGAVSSTVEVMKGDGDDNSDNGRTEGSTGIVVPVGFTQEIFDAAVKSIEYLVLTNTWPKFVKWNGIGNGSGS